MAGLDLGPGDEIVSSDQEHPGVIGPLKAARERGATVRLVPFPGLAEAVPAHTTPVGRSHVGWGLDRVEPAAAGGVDGAVGRPAGTGRGAGPVDLGAVV